MSELLELSHKICKRARELGADEATVVASEGTHTTITRRGGRVEQATEASTRGVGLSLMVDGRFSSHSTSDLRTQALDAFLTQAIAATRFLEEDPDRRLPDPSLCGRGASEAELDQLDPAWAARTPGERAAQVKQLEAEVAERCDDKVISAAVYVADGSSRSARVTTDGFADEHAGAWFAAGGEMTLEDADGRRPEAAAYYGTRYLGELPSTSAIADEIAERARERLGSRPIASGTYPLVLLNRAVGRILRILGGPLSAGAIHHGRSCLADKLGQRIGSEALTILDDPTIPRGLGSRPWDGDGLVARPRTIVEHGVLRSHYVDVYYGRKLGWEPTTGSRSNWVVPSGERPWQDVARSMPQAILVNGFLGGNSNPVTGDFSFGVRGVLLEHGEPVKPISEMNVSGNLLTIFDKLVAVGNDPWAYSALRSPTLVFDDVQFSGT